MDKLNNILPERPKAPAKLTKNSKIFKTIINAIDDKKGENVVALDLRKVDDAVADFFVVCDAQTNIQIKAIVDHIEREVRDICAERPYRTEKGDAWALIDYVNIVVHVFNTEHRKFYDLEGLWADAVRSEH